MDMMFGLLDLDTVKDTAATKQAVFTASHDEINGETRFDRSHVSLGSHWRDTEHKKRVRPHTASCSTSSAIGQGPPQLVQHTKSVENMFRRPRDVSKFSNQLRHPECNKNLRGDRALNQGEAGLVVAGCERPRYGDRLTACS